MKFEIMLGGATIHTVMRSFGYVPERQDFKTGELKFYRMLRGSRYPRFHIYCALTPDEKKATLNLHLDQKQPSYKGSRAHSGEYDGPLLQQEAMRLQQRIKT